MTNVTAIVNFIVVDQTSSYNSILRTLNLCIIKAKALNYHYTLKIPTKVAVEVLKSEQREVKEYYDISFRMGNETLQIKCLYPRIVKDDQWVSLIKDLDDFPLGEDLTKVVDVNWMIN